MSIVEILGFFIAVLAMIFLVFRQIWEERRRKAYPEEFEQRKKRQEEQVRRFLREMQIDGNEDETETGWEEEEEEEAVLPPPPFRDTTDQPAKTFSDVILEREIGQEELVIATGRGLHFPFGEIKRSLEGECEVDPFYYPVEKEKASFAGEVLDRLPSLQEMVILSEIFCRPKGM